MEEGCNHVYDCLQDVAKVTCWEHERGGLEEEYLRLNLGCGYLHRDGFVNIDKDRACNPDLVCDLSRERLPIDDNSVSYVYGSQVLEHLFDDELVFLFDELKRVCRNGAVMEFISPHMFSPVMGLIEHRKLLSEQSFRMMTWLDVDTDVKFGVIWYKLKGVLPIPYVLPTSVHYRLVVMKDRG